MRQGPGFKQLLKLEDLAANEQIGFPVVEILGDRRVLIEHHRGVVAYGCHEIGIRVRYGILVINGTGLCLARMTKDQIVIHGCIESIRLPWRESLPRCR